MRITPANAVNGEVKLPGDKSISHRAAIFSAIASGRTVISNYSRAEDCRSTLQCLRQLGVQIEETPATVTVEGVGKRGLQAPLEPLDCGNSGTTMRLLAGILAGQSFDSVLTGDRSLSKRPMRRIIEPLTLMNATIESENDCAPLKICGENPLRAIEYKLAVASAQVKSCVLLAGLNARGKSKVQSPKSKVPAPNSRNHTELMLSYLGAEIEENFVEVEDSFVHEISIDGESKLSARDIKVPSDISSAAFFLVAAACLKDSEIVLKNIGLNPTRRAIIDVLQSLGARIEILAENEICNELVGDVRVRGSESLVPKIDSNVIGGDTIANLIDEIPALAVFGTQLETGLEIRDARELRVKESDRIKAIVENLRRMNAETEEFADGFRVGKSALKGARVDSYGDHRIAMALSVAALFAEGDTEIIGAECAGVSFPEFFQTLSSIKNN